LTKDKSGLKYDLGKAKLFFIETEMNAIQLTGILAILGTTLYAVGDVLLLAGKVNLDEHPRLKPYVKLLSDAEKMIVLPPDRMIWGALLGVFATPLTMAGYWQLYQGMNGANDALILTMTLLFGTGSVLGAFVHGTFYYMGEYVHALDKVDEASQPVIADMFSRHRKVLIISYAPVMIAILIASILFSVIVATQTTAFPSWMIAVNPITLIIAWLVLKRFLPQFVRDRTEGAGFNIAFMAFFICTTITLWNYS
jgi:hypothetical protein